MACQGRHNRLRHHDLHGELESATGTAKHRRSQRQPLWNAWQDAPRSPDVQNHGKDLRALHAHDGRPPGAVADGQRQEQGAHQLRDLSRGLFAQLLYLHHSRRNRKLDHCRERVLLFTVLHMLRFVLLVAGGLRRPSSVRGKLVRQEYQRSRNVLLPVDFQCGAHERHAHVALRCPDNVCGGGSWRLQCHEYDLDEYIYQHVFLIFM